MVQSKNRTGATTTPPTKALFMMFNSNPPPPRIHSIKMNEKELKILVECVGDILLLEVIEENFREKRNWGIKNL